MPHPRHPRHPSRLHPFHRRTWLGLAAAVAAGLVVATLPAGGAGAQTPPIVELAFYEVFAAPGDEVTFNASRSFDPDGGELTFAWDFDGDGTADSTGPEPVVTHVFEEPFEGTATVRATSAAGGEATAEIEVVIASEEQITEVFAPPRPPEDVAVRRTGADTAELTWAPSPSPDVAGYVINDAESGTRLGVPAPGDTAKTIEDVPATAVRIAIRSQNELGRESEAVEVGLAATGEESSGDGGRSLALPAAAAALVVAAGVAFVVVRRGRARSTVDPA